jgi:hypothetical protein
MHLPHVFIHGASAFMTSATRAEGSDSSDWLLAVLNSSIHERHRDSNPSDIEYI